MKKRLVSVILCMAMAASLLSGCGNSSNNADANQDASSNVMSGGEVEESQESADGATSITFWKWIPVEGIQIDSLMEAWNEEYPDININITHVGESSAYFEKISAALPADEGPTVIAMQVGARANQFKEYLEPLDTYAAAEWGDDWENKFLDTALEQCRFSADENASYYVMPGGMTAVPIIEYNVAAFEKLGVTAPETMDDIYDIIEAAKADPDMIPGVAIGASEGWTCRDVWMSIIQQIAPGKLYEAQDGNASFTDPEFIESFEIWKEMWDKGFFADGSLGMALYPDINNNNFCMAGDDGSKYYIMENNGTWHGSGLPASTQKDNVEQGLQSANLVRGMFTLPSVKEGTSPASVASVDVCWGINKNASDAEKQAAWKFIAWMSEGHGQEIWANTLQILPCDKDSSLDKAYADIDNEYNEKALKLCEEIVANASGARELKYSELTNAINDGLVSIAAGTMSVDEVAQNIQMISESITR